MKNLLFSFLCSIIVGRATAQLCGQGYYYQVTNNYCTWYHVGGSVTATGAGPNVLSGSSGLAIGPNFGFSAPNPTYWSILNGNYYYYSYSGWVNTGHSAGGTGFTNPGGSQNFIYNIDANGQISVYNGTTNATILTTLGNFAGSNTVQDIVGDSNDNFYLLSNAQPAGLYIFNSLGVQTCSYAIAGMPSGAVGFAIANNKVNLSGNFSSAYAGVLSGNTVSFSSMNSNFPCGIVNDLASCPSDAVLVPVISAIPSGSISCFAPTPTLTTNGNLEANSYSWSGPGIIGSANANSIVVNAQGVYSLNMINCVGFQRLSTFTVGYDIGVKNLASFQTALVKCKNDAPVSMIVNGLANYTWSPANSLSSASGSNVLASPTITTVYTVSASLNGCTASKTFTIEANPFPPLSPSASNQSICAGISVSLLSSANVTLNWMPGSLNGATVSVSPAVSTVYTVTGTDQLGCSESATISVDVFNYPAITVSADKQEICEGGSLVISGSGTNYLTLQPGNLNGTIFTVAPAASIVYSVSSSNWNCISTQTLFVSVHSLPVITITGVNNSVCENEPVTLMATGALNYSWNNGISSSSVVVYPALNNNFYSVTGTNSFGCENTSTYSQLVDACTMLKEAQEKVALSFAPNPAKGNLKLTFASLPSDMMVIISDLTGKTIISTAVTDKVQNIHFNTANGVYNLTLVKNKTVVSNHKLLVVNE